MTQEEKDTLLAEIALLTKQRNELAFNAGRKHGQLDAELKHVREDAALVVHALNCAIQLTDALIAYLPEGSPIHPNVATCKSTLDTAMLALRNIKR